MSFTLPGGAEGRVAALGDVVLERVQRCGDFTRLAGHTFRASVNGRFPVLETLRQIEACTECEICQLRCPHDLPVIEMLRATVPGMTDMLRIWEARGLSA